MRQNNRNQIPMGPIKLNPRGPTWDPIPWWICIGPPSKPLSPSDRPRFYKNK